MADVYDPIETEPWEVVLEEHERILPKQIAYLREHSDFYQRRFDEWNLDPDSIDSLEALRDVPFTTKQDERDSQADPTPAQPLGEHQAAPKSALNRTISSSGTTGKPTYFGLTAQDRRDWNTVQQRVFYTLGVRPEDTVLFGAGQTMITGGTPYFESLTKLGANVVPAGGESTDRLLSVALDIYPDILWTTTSHIRYLSEQAESVTGVAPEDFAFSKVIGGGAPGIGNPEIRQEFYELWDADLVREGMGLGDVLGAMWGECPEEHGMHFHGQGYVHVELIDPETGEARPFEADTEGELVYTHLRREAVPLLRFRSGDYVRVTGTDCACGRTSPRIQVMGRADDMLIYKGMNVFPSAIRDVISDVPGVAPRLRVLLPEPNKVNFEQPIPVEIARAPDSDASEETLIENAITAVREQLKARIAPTVVSEADLPPGEYKTDLVEYRDE